MPPFHIESGRFRGVWKLRLMRAVTGKAAWFVIYTHSTGAWPLGSNGTMDAVKVHRPRDFRWDVRKLSRNWRFSFRRRSRVRRRDPFPRTINFPGFLRSLTKPKRPMVI